MSKNENEGCLVAIISIAPVVSWLFTGYLAWNFVEPHSFTGAIGFILAWGIFGYIAQIVIGGILVSFMDK